MFALRNKSQTAHHVVDLKQIEDDFAELHERIRLGKAEPISDEVRARAARLHMEMTAKLGRKSPQWIIDMSTRDQQA